MIAAVKCKQRSRNGSVFKRNATPYYDKTMTVEKLGSVPVVIQLSDSTGTLSPIIKLIFFSVLIGSSQRLENRLVSQNLGGSNDAHPKHYTVLTAHFHPTVVRS